ncbi:hypothetical protein V8V91_01840 [Algoriphagus halophilus]|uniref:hypothetical protein n=1 Tax=Algoriphagus halophilus TaxID=226505 RepID=UPI00358E9521
MGLDVFGRCLVFQELFLELLKNLEYHHFKYDSHPILLQTHVHFYDAEAFSFGNNILLKAGDQMTVAWEGMGRPLVNYL